MLQLDTHNKNVCDEYIKKILPALISRIKNGKKHAGKSFKLSKKVKDILLPKWDTDSPNDTILKSLLVGEPKEHFKQNNQIWKNLLKLYKSDSKIKKEIEVIFNYNEVFNSKKGQDTAYWLANIIGRNTCTYCNRQYIFTVEHKKESGKIQRFSRPVFDHWFPKSEFPLLSLNLYNLIPSCTICNSSVKGTTCMDLKTHIHPYVKEADAASFTFQISKEISEKAKWVLKIDRPAGSKIDRTIKDFALEEIYSQHTSLEVKDIIDFHESYPKDYINTFIDNLFKENNKGLSKTDVYRILFGVEAEAKKFLDRPFSKLKHDLLKQIGVEI